jgi:hypothetical protein
MLTANPVRVSASHGIWNALHIVTISVLLSLLIWNRIRRSICPLIDSLSELLSLLLLNPLHIWFKLQALIRWHSLSGRSKRFAFTAQRLIPILNPVVMVLIPNLLLLFWATWWVRKLLLYQIDSRELLSNKISLTIFAQHARLLLIFRSLVLILRILHTLVSLNKLKLWRMI